MINAGSGIRVAHLRKYLITPLVFAFTLLLIAVPVAQASPNASALVGPKKHYLALGDSLAYGYQPDLNFASGYVDDFYANLRGHGVSSVANMGCIGETSTTFLNGNCPFSLLRKYFYTGSQLNAAVAYIKLYAGQVSPVTLDIGANDVLPDMNTNTCVVNASKFNSDLATLDANLTQRILPALHSALIVNGQVTGDLLVMNSYDPYIKLCPGTLSYQQTFNQHIANDVSAYARLVDVFGAFGGTSSANICSYTWICTAGVKDVHATNTGYSVIASAFERTAGY